MDQKLGAIIDEGIKGSRRFMAYQEPGGWIYPAEDFERETGLKGISLQYAIPDGRNSEEAHFYLVSKEIKADMAEVLLGMARKMGEPLTEVRAEEYVASVKADAKTAREALKEAKKDNAGFDEIEDLAVDCYRAESRVSLAKDFKKLVKAYGAELGDNLMAATQELRQDYKAEMLDFYDKLAALNPELKAIPVDRENIRQLQDVVDGALSHFNVPDIIGFSIDKITGVQAQQDPEWVKNNDAIEKATGASMYWIASKPTQGITLSQLAEKSKSHVGREEQRRKASPSELAR